MDKIILIPAKCLKYFEGVSDKSINSQEVIQMLKKSVLATGVSLVLLSASAQAASTNPTLHDKISFRAGAFISDIDTSVTIAGAFISDIDTSVTINGEKFDFEEVLDDSVTTGAITALWRVTNKLRLNFGYWAVNRDESESLGQSESIGGINVPAGTTLGASFDTSYLPPWGRHLIQVI
jgi:opacity protein-like surface antigen